jgi:hypothetical protein
MRGAEKWRFFCRKGARKNGYYQGCRQISVVWRCLFLTQDCNMSVFTSAFWSKQQFSPLEPLIKSKKRECGAKALGFVNGFSSHE